MSMPPPLAGPSRLDRFCLPWMVVLGIVLGLLALAWSGRVVVRQTWHREFVRFHPLIAPDAQYQPTVPEMQAIVRSQCRSDQILVIVGGNSIFLGVGQPAERVWTKQLQGLLGEEFAVVNLAFRGSSVTDGGAIVAETLRDEYPRQIYLANTSPLLPPSPVGLDTYQFILLDAHYKGWLLPWEPRERYIDDFLRHSSEKFEQSLGLRLDAWLYQRSFWNWWSFTRFFTFPTPMTPDRVAAFRARGATQDLETDYEATPTALRFSGPAVSADLAIARAFSASGYESDGAGGWRPHEPTHNTLRRHIAEALPDPLKRRTIIAVSRNSPFYTRQLPPDMQRRDAIAYADTVKAWQDGGYQAFEYGADFTNDDFGDRTHLTTRGGRKLAGVVAAEVRAAAETLGYLPAR